MTRETKVGLVVAASFLCLVGVVVASRLRRDADKNQGEVVAQAITPKVEAVTKHDNEHKQEPQSLKNQDAHGIPQEPKNSPPAVMPAGLTETSLVPIPPVTAMPPPLSPPAAPHADQHLDGKSPVDAAEMEHKEKLKALELAIKGNSSKSAPGEHAAKTVDGPPHPASPPASDFPPAPIVPGADAQLKKDGFFAQAPEAHALGNGPNADPLAPHKKEEPSVHPTTTATEQPGKVNNAPPAVPAPPVNGPLANPLVPPANPPTAGHDLSTPPPVAPLVDQKPKVAEPPPVAAKGQTPPTQLVFNQQPPNPIRAPLDSATTKPVPAVAPPIPVKAPSGPAPQVKITDIESYECKADDTFDAISTRFFNTPKYARALLQYNRDNPITGKDNLLQDNPRLQPRQIVYVPPHEFLETRFASLIDNRGNLPSVAPAISIKAPVTTNPASQAPRVPAVATSDVTKPYRVPDQGQMLIEIAQQKLGDRGRWSEIYRLNPSLRPEFPIPGGTEIRLPANAN